MKQKLFYLVFFLISRNFTTNAQSELLVHYKLDETTDTIVADSGGNGYNAVLKGTAIWKEGLHGGALELDGNSYVILPAEDIGLTSDSGSVVFWMKSNNPTNISSSALFWADENATGNGFGPDNEMHVNLEVEVPSVWTGGELSFFIASTPLIHLFSDPEKGTDPELPPVNPILMGDDQWHLVIAIWGDSKAGMYIDGKLIMEKVYTSTSYDLNNIYIGKMGTSTTRNYIGKLDEFKIYSGVLSNQEIIDLFNEEKPVVTCTDTIWIYDTIWVNDTNVITIYDSISVTDTLIIDVISTNIIPTINKNTIKIYPNPTNEIVYINTGENYLIMENYSIKIVNSSGIEFFNSYINQSGFEINISEFGETGLYFIQILDENNLVVDIRKLVLE